MNNLFTSSEDILLYKTANHLILFKEKQILNSGFALVDENHYIILEGQKPVGIEQGTFAINPSLVIVLSPKDNYLHIRYNDNFSYIFYHKDNEYIANDGISPNSIISTGYLKEFNYIKISNKSKVESDLEIAKKGAAKITLNDSEINTAFIREVFKFHKLFNHPVLATPQIPSLERSSLRISLLKEEIKEFNDGIENMDIVEVADALADTMYVLCGAILEFGLGNKFYEIFEEVQRSNMSKACTSEEEAIATVNKYKSEGVATYFQKKKGEELYLIYRVSDNKVLKSINYSPADIASILNK